MLAITEGMEGAEDVYSLAQEAAAEHACLMAKLSEVGIIADVETVYLVLSIFIKLYDRILFYDLDGDEYQRFATLNLFLSI